jgi:hypothetical protein
MKSDGGLIQKDKYIDRHKCLLGGHGPLTRRRSVTKRGYTFHAETVESTFLPVFIFLLSLSVHYPLFCFCSLSRVRFPYIAPPPQLFLSTPTLHHLHFHQHPIPIIQYSSLLLQKLNSRTNYFTQSLTSCFCIVRLI